LSTVHEPTEHVLERELQGQEEDQTLCCLQFMNLQNMFLRKKILNESRNKTGIFVVHGS
jgi:hypothetical protein